MNITWIVWGVASLILLAFYFRRRNAVWGGLTAGIIIGVLWKFIGGTDWYIVIKVVTVATFLGFGAELLGMLFDYLKRKS